MRRRGLVERRRVIFIGVEGQSERAFVRFLGRCCERKELHLHLDVKSANGGDSVTVVEAGAPYVSRRSEHSRRLVLLDQDRIERDRKAGRDAWAVASTLRLEIVLQRPNLEGLLLRLHPGQEHRRLQAQDAMKELRKVWPEYRKPPTADQLDQRFDMPALLRSAEHDEHLRRLLEVLGLWVPH